MRNARHQPSECCKFFRFDQRVLGFLQISQRGLGRIPGAAYLLLARQQRAFRALALGNFFRGDINAENFAGWAAHRVPISNPKAFLGLVGALTGDLDAGHRLAGLHDRTDDAFDRLGQRRYAIPHRTPEMILD